MWVASLPPTLCYKIVKMYLRKNKWFSSRQIPYLTTTFAC
ncbi:unnamed protein product [Brassica oleracea]